MIWIPLLAAWYSMKVNQLEWERLQANSTMNATIPAALERRSEPNRHCEEIKAHCDRLWTNLRLQEQSEGPRLDCEEVLRYGPDCLYSAFE
jgi:hypothetical protein